LNDEANSLVSFSHQNKEKTLYQNTVCPQTLQCSRQSSTACWPQSFTFLSVGKCKTVAYSAPTENEEMFYRCIFGGCQTIRNRTGNFESVR